MGSNPPAATKIAPPMVVERNYTLGRKRQALTADLAGGRAGYVVQLDRILGS